MKSIKQAVEEYLYDYPPALELFQKFMEVGSVYLIGGVLREYKDKNRIEELRDVDIIINIQHHKQWRELLEKYQPERNHFGGYKFLCSGFIVDVWEVEKTWAFRENKIDFNEEKILEILPKTVFLNIDSIIYDLCHDGWYDSIYREANETGVIDVVLEENPHIDLNILRAMILRRKYSMRYSNKLKEIVQKEFNMDECLIDMLYEIQASRYHKEILSKAIIEEELKLFL